MAQGSERLELCSKIGNKLYLQSSIAQSIALVSCISLGSVLICVSKVSQDMELVSKINLEVAGHG